MGGEAQKKKIEDLQKQVASMQQLLSKEQSMLKEKEMSMKQLQTKNDDLSKAVKSKDTELAAANKSIKNLTDQNKKFE